MTWDLPPPRQPFNSSEPSIPTSIAARPIPAWPTETDHHPLDLADFPGAPSTSLESLEANLPNQILPPVLSILDLQPTVPPLTSAYDLQSYQPIFQPTHTAPIALVGSPELFDFLNSGSFSDATLVVGKSARRFRVHKVVLAAKSSLFGGMFALLDQEKNPSIEVRDVREEVMYDLLRFVYEGRIERIESCAYQLCLAAERFEIPELRERCCGRLLDEDSVCIRDDNVYEVLDFAVKRGAAEIQRRAVDYVIGVY